MIAEVELLRLENRRLRQIVQSCDEARAEILPWLDNIRRAVLSLSPAGDVLGSPQEGDNSTSPLSPISADKLYRMNNSE